MKTIVFCTDDRASGPLPKAGAGVPRRALLPLAVGAALPLLSARAGAQAIAPAAGQGNLAADARWQPALQRAHALRDEAQRGGDQPYGAVVVKDGRIVGEAPSRVVTRSDPTAHAEMEAIRDAARRLASRDLSGCVLVSSSRPCGMCESAAAWARIERMVYGEGTDGGAPRVR